MTASPNVGGGDKMENMSSTPVIDPARTALLLMDFQSGIVDSLPASEALLQRAAAARETAAAAGVHTVYVRVAFTDGARARVSADHDYRLFVLADCCADRDDEVHRLLLDRVFVRQADIIQSSDLEQLLGVCVVHT